MRKSIFKKLIVELSVVILALVSFPAFTALAAENNGDNLSVKYQTHIQNIGWQHYIYDGQMSGTSGLSYRLEGINIAIENPIPGMKIKYQTHVQNVGWQDWKYDGQTSGSVGASQRLEGIKIMLEGAPVGYHVLYQVHVQNIGWQKWVSDGQMAGTEGKSLRLEGIKIQIVNDTSSVYGKLGLNYRTHVENEGWQEYAHEGQFSGTSGLSYRLEGINIALANPIQGMRIKYETHVQDVGWQGWKYDGAMSGTSGQSKRLEGIKIALEGAPAWFHVKYQVHVQNEGWQAWVQDGQIAGTEGRSLRLEGIRIQIVDSKGFVYSNYNISLDYMVNAQIASKSNAAMHMKNSVGVYEWRYAEIQNNQEGYYIFVNRKDEFGNDVKNEKGEIVKDEVWTYSPDIYQFIKQKLKDNLDPNIIINNNTSIYQFLKLSYVEGTTAEQLNKLFKAEGVLAGKGQVFLDAAKANNINPIYLAAHSILETGNGTSNLARGIEVDGINGKMVVYNLFGIQAFDGNADASGSDFAYKKGWTNIDEAVRGGAAWISNGYINNPTYKQDTLYKMRWYPQNPTHWHKYSTDVEWASKQTSYIKQCFDMVKDAKLVFDFPVYK
jgi:beta-N-acetylglucosaminidase/uncharacterized protein YjdB